jgi:APA family basic amino acid/polyamine antiporter
MADLRLSNQRSSAKISGYRLNSKLTTQNSKLSRQIGLFDATMVVMGGIIGSGIFLNPAVVARALPTPSLMLAAWLTGGVVSICGAFIYAELSARMPFTGGEYAYLREAYGPLVAFLYGWATLLVVQTGGMAAVSVTFARYALDLTGSHLPDSIVAVAAMVALTVVNCLGVKMGTKVQSALTLLKIGAIAALVIFGLTIAHAPAATAAPARSPRLLSDFFAALIAVMFAYGGWQTATYVAGEVRDPRRNLPRALMLGVAGVIACYVLVSYVVVRALGAVGLAASMAPASGVMQLALGRAGAVVIAAGIAISTLGFLSQSVLTAPRVYFAMAEDGLFFRAVARVHPKTHVPVVAIILQSVWTIVIALSGTYERMLAYTIATNAFAWGLTATCVFVFRRRTRPSRGPGRSDRPSFAIPGHPFTTLLFTAMCWAITANAIYRYPADALKGVAIVVAGVPVYFLWRRRRAHDAKI